ncbi:MAG: oxidoreductase [Saccharopolyspora sp.]|uniref:oxidoreductase n=1 Tax=Saccharopolyspora sp. TaxID=33915 RepID=UPI0025EE98A2|nr:oxidoreductase [Saccharopolyspora sp.]MBQ6643262.1 oxidoreductase [Saccharopolyspora sp.]
MPNRPWDNAGAPTTAEQRLDDLLGQGRAWGRRQDTPVIPLDVHADMYDPEREIRGEYLTRKLVESPDEQGWRAFWRRGGQQPVVRIEDAVITGRLDLRAAELPYLLEFVRCRFDMRPDLRQATLTGLVLWHCRFPGLNGRNLHTSHDTVLRNCTSIGGTVDLADAELGGSLQLDDSELRNPGGRAIYADRLAVAGAMLGQRIKVSGEVRIPGAKIGGNLNFSGGALRNRGRNALNANGIQIGGSLRGDVDRISGAPFTVAGLLYLPSAHLQGDLRLRDAVLEPGVSPPKRGESQYDDPISTLLLDRGEVRGDVQLDQNFRSGGTIRLVSSKIGGDLRMAGAQIDLSWARSPAASVDQPMRALHLDGTEVLGNLEAVGATLHGQMRMVDVRVHGSFQLTRASLAGPRTDTVQANRIQVGSNFDCREADITGTLQLQGANIGANVDLRAAQLLKPAWHRHRRAYKSSLDLRAASIGRDLVCAEGKQFFRAEGEVQLRRAVIGRQANFWGCVLGDGSSANAFNAFGLVAQEIMLLPAQPPQGRVVLRQAQCELLDDNALTWSATRGVDVEDFAYYNLSHPIEPTDAARVRERLSWLRATTGRYQPGPYDQLAEVFRNNGNEEHAVTVLIEKQRRRYQALAGASPRLLRPSVRLWSMLQRSTVAYGYRPLRALLWLLAFAVGGTVWFSYHRLEPINEEDNPIWNPLLYTVDQLVPIINLGHDVMWRAEGNSQWITVVLIAAGWILATTVAAGITRALRREH